MPRIKIDSYYDITCCECGRSWSTDFNANTHHMEACGMGMADSKMWLYRAAKRSGWKSVNGLTTCPDCIEMMDVIKHP